MTTYFTGDFADFGSDWVNRYNDSTQWAVTSGDLVYPQGKASDWQAWTWNDVEDGNHANIEALLKLTLSSNTGAATYPFIFRASGSDESPTHYGLYIYGGSNRLRLTYNAGSDTPTEIASSTSVTLSASTTYWVRVRINGSGTVTVQARIWLDGDSEPGSWQINTTTTAGPASSAGWNGVATFANQAANAHTLLQLGIGTNGDTAPSSAGGGGTSYDVSLSEALTATDADAAAVAWLGAASESIAATTDQASTWTGDVMVAIALAVTTAESNTLATTQAVGETLAVVTAQAQDSAITLTVSESLGLVSTEAASAALGVAVAEAVSATTAEAGTAAFGVAIGEAIGLVTAQLIAGSTYDVAIAEALAATDVHAVTVTLGGIITETLGLLDATGVTSVETASVAFGVGVADTAVATLIAQLGITEAVSITTTEAGSIITAEFSTPDGRTLRVLFDNRTLAVRYDDRTLYVSSTTH